MLVILEAFLTSPLKLLKRVRMGSQAVKTQLFWMTAQYVIIPFVKVPVFKLSLMTIFSSDLGPRVCVKSETPFQ